MKQERKVLRAGVVMILLAAVWRVAAGGNWMPVVEFLGSEKAAAFLFYLSTGRVVHPEAAAREETQAAVGLIPTAATAPTEGEKPPQLQFSQEDTACFALYDLAKKPVDAQALLLSPLEWELVGDAPTVLILHTHATESYTKNGEDYEESAHYRTRDTHYNMVQIGARLTQALEAAGIGVIHDTTLHDYPSYTGSYNNSRKAVEDYLEAYPSIELVLDLHRDAALDAKGRQMVTRAEVNGAVSAQLMLVVGTNASGLKHPNWKENMALAAKLHVTLEKAHEGIARPICFRAERFNQDLHPGMLLIEVGSAGNTQQQAFLATDCLAQAIIALAHGAN